MKTSKEARRAARKIFAVCFVGGRLDEARARSAFSAVIAAKPRGYLGILQEMQRRLKSEVAKSQMVIESAVPMDEARLRQIQDETQAHFKMNLEVASSVNPALIGGLRIRVGSNVWDGSVAARLQQLGIEN